MRGRLSSPAPAHLVKRRQHGQVCRLYNNGADKHRIAASCYIVHQSNNGQGQGAAAVSENLHNGEGGRILLPPEHSPGEQGNARCAHRVNGSKEKGGSNSGGGIFFELTNTHLLVQFDVEYCLNSDGSCNMETGTEPDIVADDALAAVLALIEENSKVY